MSKKAKIYVGFALFFLCLVVFLVPAVGAPRVDRTGFTKLQESQEYLEMINSVYNYVLQNYVEDVDPEILYRGAMEGYDSCF